MRRWSHSSSTASWKSGFRLRPMPIWRSSLGAGPHQDDLVELPAQAGQHDPGGLPVGDVGGGHQHHEQQAEAVHDDVPAPAIDLMGGS